MRNEMYDISAMIGNDVKEGRLTFNENWAYDKEVATVIEKAINFSKKSGKAIMECINKKKEEMANGYLLVKTHDFDEITRGYIAGLELGGFTEGSNKNIMDEAEKNWDAIAFDGVNNVKTGGIYSALLLNAKDRQHYKDMGMITLQELTRKCLAMMDEGNKDKFVIVENGRGFSICNGFEKSKDEIASRVGDGMHPMDLVMLA